MSFLGNSKLAKVITTEGVVSCFNPDRIKNGAYELSLGEEVFQTDSSPRNIKKLVDGEQIEIKPGQFALLLTKEVVKIPENKIGFISIKAGIKFKGLINVSGFHVDPGFEGRLLFSVYNAGNYTIRLTHGRPYFPMWLCELTGSQQYNGDHEKQHYIPQGPVEALCQGELASPVVLSKKIDDINFELDRRVGLIEKDLKANNYIIVTAVGLVIALVLKFLFDFYMYNTGLSKGEEIKMKEIKGDSAINIILAEKKRLLLEIDSLRHISYKLNDENRR